jgi:glucose-1-phosphate cytidylyltransferase
MKAVILCGGQGTRLREETEFRPKPLVPIGDKPILWHIMKILSQSGIRDFVLCLGYRGNMIKEYFLNYEAMNNDFSICLGEQHTIQYHNAHGEQEFRVTLVDTGQSTMTGGRLRRVRRYVQDDPEFLVTYGDGVADIDVQAVHAFHNSHGRIGTISTVRPQSRFGLIEIGQDQKVASFVEKPQMDSWANVGFQVFKQDIFEYLTGDDCILEREPLERLAAAGELMAYQHRGFFYAMDTYREYQFLNELWESGKAPWKTWD